MRLGPSSCSWVLPTGTRLIDDHQTPWLVPIGPQVGARNQRKGAVGLCLQFVAIAQREIDRLRAYVTSVIWAEAPGCSNLSLQATRTSDGTQN